MIDTASSSSAAERVVMEISPSPVRHHQSAAALTCPRCHSANTKFCYYNNYSLSQPRHFCKACKRYWTRGGTLRNVPVGGGCRKNKRALVKKAPQPTTATKLAPAHDDPLQLPLDLPSSTSSTSSAITIRYNSTTDSSVLLVNSFPTLPSANFHGRPSCTGTAFVDQYQSLLWHMQPPERATLLGHEEQQQLQQRTKYEEIDAGAAEWRISTENYNNSSSQTLSLQNDYYSSPYPYLEELAGIGGRMLQIDGRRAAAHLI